MNLTIEKLIEILERPGIAKTVYASNSVPTLYVQAEPLLEALKDELNQPE